MPSRKDVLHDFIDDIPDGRLESVRDHPVNVAQDDNFHLDVQGKTSDGRLNLQIQCVKKPKLKSLSKWSTQTVAGPAFVPADAEANPETLREAFKETAVDFNDRSQQRGKRTRVKPRPGAENDDEEADQEDDKDQKGKKGKGKGKGKYGKW